MTIKDIDSLITTCKRCRLAMSDITGNSPEEVRAYADGYINCKDNLIKILEQDPRPAYINDPQRSYGIAFAGCNIRFRVTHNRLTVEAIETV